MELIGCLLQACSCCKGRRIAVPVFEKTKATSGCARTAASTCNCMPCDCERDVDGMRMACIATSFSSSVGMNSCPSRVNKSSVNTKNPVASRITYRGSFSAPSRAGAYQRLATLMIRFSVSDTLPEMKIVFYLTSTTVQS